MSVDFDEVPLMISDQEVQYLLARLRLLINEKVSARGSNPLMTYVSVIERKDDTVKTSTTVIGDINRFLMKILRDAVQITLNDPRHSKNIKLPEVH